MADTYNGLRLNSPNDVVVRSDGTIYFTDPHWGILQVVPGWASHVFAPDVPWPAMPQCAMV